MSKLIWHESKGAWPGVESIRNDWLLFIAASKGHKISHLEYHLVHDKELLLINQKYLLHDTYTDIITFDYSRASKIKGEIYISWDRVRENAKFLGLDEEEELRRVIVHGMLHLCGLKDKLEEEKKVMRQEEEKALKEYKRFHVEHNG